MRHAACIFADSAARLCKTNRTQGDHAPMHNLHERSAQCSFGGCTTPPVVTLLDQAYCLSHFYNRCYELLDEVDQKTRMQQMKFPGRHLLLTSEDLRIVDECSRTALTISLNSSGLENLDRARLLDILLWTGDLTGAIRHPTDPPPQPAPTLAPYERPRLLRMKAQNRQFF